jgi:glycosyltransferase involved in cell wall biosynthesis
MKVSIIIPVYNVERYIIRCLQSVVAQDIDDYEVLIIDDASPDGSIQLAKSFIENNNLTEKFHIVCHEKNKGLSAARNTGIRVAKGDFLFFLDSDDTIETNALSSLASFITLESQPDFVLGKYVYILDGDKKKEVFDFETRINLSRSELIHLYLKDKLPWNAVNKLVKRDFILQNGLFFEEGITSEDLLWNFLSLAKVKSCTIVNTISYNYFRNNECSIMATARNNSRYLKDLIRVVDLIQNCAESNRDNDLKQYFLHIKYHFFPTVLFWNRFPLFLTFNTLKENFSNLPHSFYQDLTSKERISLTISPASLLAINSIVRNKISTICDILRYKLNSLFHHTNE